MLACFSLGTRSTRCRREDSKTQALATWRLERWSPSCRGTVGNFISVESKFYRSARDDITWTRNSPIRPRNCDLEAYEARSLSTTRDFTSEIDITIKFSSYYPKNSCRCKTTKQSFLPRHFAYHLFRALYESCQWR